MKQVISLVLSILMLLSSSGIAYAQHFCGDFKMLSEITLGEKNLSCGMAMQHEDACGDEETEDHDCCDNEYTQVSTDDAFTLASFDLDLQDDLLLAIDISPEFEFLIVDALDNAIYTNYYPPPRVRDLVLLHETFLI